mmetsp:Transcript_17899/g.29039  ORF Transcript_17899/g.29039 Transcript_17899/m.29039 type:complete len:342 (-) Transcript_17899:1933-2958(-)|eukprot:CAMPEP_0203752344 /NCGR_PEP_ID=MMETSP0098-20131031/6273_1 /ASSEMBLY_ACC=CAM_ASM_000208 /TAXON_ID=96639 /ORGANISM=" , Strain NY0313808BC1" /LENGTH=341 /DNA_ID=CAMNT_0050642451 /DNA_START=173 /DNA_END=1198 /DNA_ORIENTATION=+
MSEVDARICACVLLWNNGAIRDRMNGGSTSWQVSGESFCTENDELVTVLEDESQVNLGLDDGKEADDGTVFCDVLTFQDGWEEEAERVVLEGGRDGGDERRAKFKMEQFEGNASKHWDYFYRRHTTNFFKDRHYLLSVFPMLKQLLSSGECKVLEVGCGVGNTIIPMAKDFPRAHTYGIDFAAKAIELLNAQNVERCRGWVCDISKTPCNGNMVVPAGIPQVNAATMMFVLSALSPRTMKTAVMNVIQRIKPGGYLFFRDYGVLDQAQVRFAKEQRLGHSYYVRQDGTTSFFFSLEALDWLFEQECGLECLESRYVRRIVVNHKDSLTMRRVFVNATYRKV